MKKTNKKLIAMLLVMALLVGGAVGGTLAWLLDKTNTITNTFTDSDINITLTESASTNPDDNDSSGNTNSYQMIPGHIIAKDPKVTVANDSEDCWLFVKVTESTTLDAYIAYAIADGWETVEGTKGSGEYVIGRKVMKTASQKSFDILGGGTYPNTTENTTDDEYPWTTNQVLVKPEVTKQMMDSIDEGAVKPTLTFTAYAVQLKNSNNTEFSVAQAWAEAQKLG